MQLGLQNQERRAQLFPLPPTAPLAHREPSTRSRASKAGSSWEPPPTIKLFPPWHRARCKNRLSNASPNSDHIEQPPLPEEAAGRAQGRGCAQSSWLTRSSETVQPELSHLGLQHLKGSLESPPDLSQGQLYCSQQQVARDLPCPPFPRFCCASLFLDPTASKTHQPAATGLFQGSPRQLPPRSPSLLTPKGRGSSCHTPLKRQTLAGFEQLQQSY